MKQIFAQKGHKGEVAIHENEADKGAESEVAASLVSTNGLAGC